MNEIQEPIETEISSTGDDLLNEKDEIASEVDVSSADQAFVQRMRLVQRSVFTALNNYLSVYQIAPPRNVSEKEWERQRFRALRPKQRAKELVEIELLKKYKREWKAADDGLQNFSTGVNRGPGGKVISEEVKEYVKQLLKMKQKVFVQRAVLSHVTKIADNHEESKVLKRELKAGYAKKLEEIFASKNDRRKKLLIKAVDAHIDRFQEKRIDSAQERKKDGLREEWLKGMETVAVDYQKEKMEAGEFGNIVGKEERKFVEQVASGQGLLTEEERNSLKMVFLKQIVSNAGKEDFVEQDWWYDRSEK